VHPRLALGAGAAGEDRGEAHLRDAAALGHEQQRPRRGVGGVRARDVLGGVVEAVAVGIPLGDRGEAAERRLLPRVGQAVAVGVEVAGHEAPDLALGQRSTVHPDVVEHAVEERAVGARPVVAAGLEGHRVDRRRADRGVGSPVAHAVEVEGDGRGAVTSEVVARGDVGATAGEERARRPDAGA